MSENYNRFAPDDRAQNRDFGRALMDNDLHSRARRLIEMRIEHADLDALIDGAATNVSDDDLALRRLKKRRLLLRDQLARLEAELGPLEWA